MATLITDPFLEEQLKAERQAWGGDLYDEVWEGVYMMAPFPANEHQEIVLKLAAILQEVVGWSGLGEVFSGTNLSDRREGWQRNYRVPDVAVFLRGGRAVNCGTHWCGAADFLVEIISPGDRTREKIPFYSQIGVVELLLVDRQPWALELYRQGEGGLEQVAASTAEASQVLSSASVPLTFQLLPGDPRPQMAVTQVPNGRRWLV